MAATPGSTFGEWCQMTTYHGVHDFYLAKNIFLKCLWFAVVITGCFFAGNQSVDFILDYALKEQWQSNVYRLTPPGDAVVWPDVAVCHGNAFESSFLTEPWRDTCQKTTIHCGVNDGFNTSSNIGCNCSRFGKPSTGRGCFILNLTAIRSQSKGFEIAGYESGVQLLLNPRTIDYNPRIESGDKLSFGLKLFVHFQGEDNEKFSKPILAGAGTHTLIGMKIELHRTTPRHSYTLQFRKPKPPCVEKFQYQWLNTPDSSRTLCRQDCFTGFALQYCRCVSPHSNMPLKIKSRICNETEEEICQREINLAKQTRSSLKSGFNLSQCFAECREPCEFLSIITEISSAPFPVPTKVAAFADYLNKATSDRNFSDDQVRQMIFVELFFESTEYKVIERVTRVSLEELISSIGGTLGVWTGLSLIGIFQAIVYLLYGFESAFIRLGAFLKNRVRVVKLSQIY